MKAVHGKSSARASLKSKPSAGKLRPVARSSSSAGLTPATAGQALQRQTACLAQPQKIGADHIADIGFLEVGFLGGGFLDGGFLDVGLAMARAMSKGRPGERDHAFAAHGIMSRWGSLALGQR